MAAVPPIEIPVKVVGPKIDVRHNMTNHPPSPAQIQVIEHMRSQFIDLGEYVQEICPPGREAGLAYDALEQALMWAVASIARNTETPDHR